MTALRRTWGSKKMGGIVFFLLIGGLGLAVLVAIVLMEFADNRKLRNKIKREVQAIERARKQR